MGLGLLLVAITVIAVVATGLVATPSTTPERSVSAARSTSSPSASLPAAPPASGQAPLTSAAPPPASTPEPPAGTPEPPAGTPEPPAGTPEPPAGTPEPPAGTPEPPAGTPEPPTQGMVQVAAPTRVEVPSVGLAVDVLPITPDGGALDPPTLDEAYWIETYGAPGTASDNTVYLAGHSYDSGSAAFNPLFDKDAQVALVEAGDEVLVSTRSGRLRYTVESTERLPKDELAGVEEVWKIVPGRLVLITCFQRNDGGASQDNLVVYASLVAGEL